ncbi:hypothetical protein [Mesorhizobium caraganae]|uniref:hypothetical protein n=1 Tax=Mesorhizobium caraganae TaxID=483206 RepID=UPI00177E8BD3|nr:hypothetical protein [Mesorhizobium caraganae]
MPFKDPHPLYSIWQGMRRRCLTPTYRQWADYGGRGITICPEWNDFDQFVRDMGARPSPTHSLDRIDNDGNYEPGNCRWATKSEQQKNQRRAVWVEIDGTRYRAIDLSKEYNLKPDTIVSRAARGMSFNDVTTPVRHVNRRVPIEAITAHRANAKTATHCRRGHEWTTENTYTTKGGWRTCRQCHNAKMRRLWATKIKKQAP